MLKETMHSPKKLEEPALDILSMLFGNQTRNEFRRALSGAWGKEKCSALTAKFPVGKRYEHGCTSWQCIWSMLRDVDYMACCWFLIQICLRRSYTVHSRRQFQSRQWLRIWMFIERRRFQQHRSRRKQTYCARRPQQGISIPWIWSSL